MDPSSETLWEENSGSGLGHHPTSDYEVSSDISAKQALIYQERLRYKMISLWIKNSLTKDEKRKLRSYKISYSYNRQDDGSTIFFVILTMAIPNTRTGCSDINKNM